MLTKEWVEDKIWDGLPLGAKKLMRRSNSEYYVPILAEAIAQAAEDERHHALEAQNATWRDLESIGLATIAGLQAQVAVMAEALQTVLDYVDDVHKEGKGHLTMVGVCKQVEQALSAAPKVVYHDTFKTKGLEDCVKLMSRTGDAEFRTTDGALDNDGRLYDVLVLAHEQGQDSEQVYKPGTLLTSGYSPRQHYYPSDDEDVAEPQQPPGDTEEMIQEE